MTTIKLNESGDFEIAISGDRFAEHLEAVRGFTVRRFDPDAKTWAVPYSQKHEIVAWLDNGNGDTLDGTDSRTVIELGAINNRTANPSRLSHPLTGEQIEIVDAAQMLERGDSMAVAAFAGTGKTSTAIVVAEAINGRILYLAFNKAIAEEAKRKMPDHVEVRTAHSMAYHAMRVGLRFKHKLAKYITARDMERVELEPSIWVKYGKSEALIKQAIKATVMQYVKSKNHNLSTEHVPRFFVDKIEPRDVIDETSKHVIRGEFMQDVMNHAVNMWALIADERTDFPLTHDCYLKMWQLSGATLSTYDLVIFDEYQDSDPVMIDILRRSECSVIGLGDKHQGIYGFRGAYNAMADHEKILPLTQSFRFGPWIADIANKILQCGEDKPDFELRGFEKINSSALDAAGAIWDRDAVIFRTNSGVFSRCLRYIKDDVPFTVLGGVEDMCKQLESAWYLYEGDLSRVKHGDLKPFESWDELCGQVEEDDGAGALGVLKRRVEEYLGQIPGLCEDIREAAKKPRTGAEVVLCTAHKSKGLEWPNVELGNDFPSLLPHPETKALPDQQEVNLLYVAATRAQRLLMYNSQIAELLASN